MNRINNISIITLIYNYNIDVVQKRFLRLNLDKADETIFVLNKFSSRRVILFNYSDEYLIKRYNIPITLINLSKKYNIKFLIPKNKASLSSSRNEGVNHSKYKFVAILDEDVIPSNSWVRAVKYNLNNNVDFVFGPDTHISKKNLFSWYRNELELYFKRNLITLKYTNIGRNNFIICAGRNIAFNKDKFRNIGGFNNKFNFYFGEDLDLQIRFLFNSYNMRYVADMKSTHIHHIGVYDFLYKFYLAGKSDYNWNRINAKYLLHNKLEVSFSNNIDHLIVFYLLILLFLNIYFGVFFYILYGLIKTFNLVKLRLRFDKLFLILSIFILPLKNILASLGYYIELIKSKW